MAGAIAALTAAFAASPPRAETIAVWHAMSGKAGDAVQAQCARFNASQSEHAVRCGFQGDYARLMQKAVAAFRAGRQPALVASRRKYGRAVGEVEAELAERHKPEDPGGARRRRVVE